MSLTIEAQNRKACWTVKDGVTVGQLLSSTWQSPHLPRKLIGPSDIVNPHLILIIFFRVVEKFVIGLDIPLPTPRSLLLLLVRVEVDVRVLAIFDRRPRRTAVPSSVR